MSIMNVALCGHCDQWISVKIVMEFSDKWKNSDNGYGIHSYIRGIESTPAQRRLDYATCRYHRPKTANLWGWFNYITDNEQERQARWNWSDTGYGGAGGTGEPRAWSKTYVTGGGEKERGNQRTNYAWRHCVGFYRRVECIESTWVKSRQVGQCLCLSLSLFFSLFLARCIARSLFFLIASHCSPRWKLHLWARRVFSARTRWEVVKTELRNFMAGKSMAR